MERFISPFIVATLIAYFATPFVIKLAWRWGLIDDPAKNKHIKVIHNIKTPRAGGIASFVAIIIASLIFLPLDKHLTGILIGATIVTAMGVADDKYNISPYKRLFVQFLAAGAVVAAGIGISYISNPLGGIIDLSNPKIVFNLLGESRSIWILSDAFALFWIVSLMNFLNMGAKGVDGQLTGIVVIAASALGILSLKFSADIAEWPVIVLAGITAGAYFGFLPWHTYPQKIMPSFSGSNLAGFMLGVLTILTTTKVGVLAIVLAVPLVDTGYTIVRRIMNGKSPVWGDRGHLHHRLYDNGWSKRKIAYFYWGLSLVLGLIAINLNTINKVYTMVGIILLVGGLILWFTWRPRLGSSKKNGNIN